METIVVNLRREEYDVYIGRYRGRGGEVMPGANGEFGNPIVVSVRKCFMCGKPHKTAGSTLPCYKKYLWGKVNSDPAFRQKIMELKGKRLGCFCKPGPCHGDIIVAYINAGCPVE